MDKQNDQKRYRILVTGGGTGGHLFPAIALMEELKSRFPDNEIDFLFIGTSRGLESSVLPNSDYPFRKIWIRGFQRGHSCRDILVNLFFPLRLIISLIQSFFIIKQFKPDFAIGSGGYTAGPPLRIAALLKIPIFLHEQNVFPGKTTRMLSRHAKAVYASFEDTGEYIEKITWVGTPLRQSLASVPKDQALRYFELPTAVKTIFIFGGSQGSRALNNYWLKHLEKFIEQSQCQFIWQTGQSDYEKISHFYAENPLVHVTPFIHEMGISYSAADIIISRSGALTLAELCLYGKPSILVPLPTAAGNHQEINARIMEKEGAAIVVLQKDLESELLNEFLQSLIRDNTKLQEMSANARRLARLDSAKVIIDDILKIMEEHVR
jgi:UDP-N-acetylglucosamine--N-acetylmuramyl-(pentapeptide) pyrophosphoryl-undecaprenol N-acetylglucosamine transferase